jgi:hypothetical protein
MTPRDVPPSRERIFHLLAEASELEHNLLCSYLYALFSLKKGSADDLHDAEREAVKRWRRTLQQVCIEEMAHMAQVANLSMAVGMRPHFDRPNLPVAPGYHPAGIVIDLAPLDAQTLQHFIYLERPDGSTAKDSDAYVPDTRAPPRGQVLRSTPSAPEYATVGAFYDMLLSELERLCNSIGESAVFCGDPARQLGADELGDRVRVVPDMATARAAIDSIVEQGEGARHDSADSHFGRFRAMERELQALTAARPSFRPSHPAARSPVMRPPVSEDRVHVCSVAASEALDLGNALYSLMLRCLAQTYESGLHERAQRTALFRVAKHLMHAMEAVGRVLVTLPAEDEALRPHAGMTFTMLRATEGYGPGVPALALVDERLRELGRHAAEMESLGSQGPYLARVFGEAQALLAPHIPEESAADQPQA